jgi:hypothetical protein
VVGDCQCGFRQGRSTAKEIFNVRQILERCEEVGIEIQFLFIDFKASCEGTDRTRL